MPSLSFARSPVPRLAATCLALLAGLAAPAAAQWKTNPINEDSWVYQDEAPTKDRCRLELDGCALVIVPGCGGLGIERLDRKGYRLGDRSFTDPAYPYVANGGKYCVNTYRDVVACKISQFDFMIAYRVDYGAGSGSPGSVLRVARMHWDDVNDTYQAFAGFPVTISSMAVDSLSITPNRTSLGIDGALIAWQVQTATPAQVTVYQQGVLALNPRVWPLATDGLVVDSYFGTASSTTQPTSIVSTGDGMAVTTYHKLVGGNWLHWTAKPQLGSDVNWFPAMQVPGQATQSPSRCCVACDGAFGAFYGFATDSTRTDLVAAQVSATGGPSAVAFWNSTQGLPRPPGPTPLLRALSFLDMPGQSALLVYRDCDGIRCIHWGNGLAYLWTRFVRGATLVNNDDDAATAFQAGVACVVSTSDADVRAIGFDVNGGQVFTTHINDPSTTNPYKSITAYGPLWPHAWATGDAWGAGFLVGWYETDGQIETEGDGPQYFLAERFTKGGKLGKSLYTGHAISGSLLDSAVAMDLQSSSALRLSTFELALAESIGANGTIEIYTAVGSSHVGIANNPAMWTLVGSCPVVSAGPTRLSTVQLSTPVVLPAGTNGLLIRGVGVSLGTTPVVGGQSFALDDLSLQCGTHIANWPIGSVQPGSVFQGGIGFELASTPVVAAVHTPYGAGCYAQSDSFYAYFPDAAAAATALTGQSMRMLPAAGNQYMVVWGGGTFVAPTFAATPLLFAPNNDDGTATIVLPAPIPVAGGLATSLVVHSNGSVWVGDNLPALQPNDYTPRRAGMLAAPHTGFWSWHDYTPSEAGSGPVLLDISPFGDVRVTWQDVESLPLGTVNRSTMQFQIDTSGAVTWVWQNIDANTTSPYGSSHLVGYSPGGPSVDGGSLTLSTSLPVHTAVGMLPLALSAAPAPMPGTVVTYTTTNIPEAAPGTGIYLGAVILSLAQSPGFDLGFLGAPGCLLHVASTDLMLTMVGATSTQPTTFSIPMGAPLGTHLYVQAAALVLPGTINAFGLTTSNGVQSRIGN